MPTLPQHGYPTPARKMSAKMQILSRRLQSITAHGSCYKLPKLNAGSLGWTQINTLNLKRGTN
jgi:hypothetical protein